MLRNYYIRHKERYLKQQREHCSQLKLEVLSNYGPEGVLGCCWSGCPVDDIDLLTLDHVHNDGGARRAEGERGGRALYHNLRKNKYPSGFQTLCWNHNAKKEIIRKRSTRLFA